MPTKKSRKQKGRGDITDKQRTSGKNPDLSYRAGLKTLSGYPASYFPYKIQMLPPSPFMITHNSSFNSIKLK